MVAHVSDFGLARLLSTIGVSHIGSSIIGLKGTIGYAPSEYGMGSKVSIEGDMYSFGFLILEMLTGKRPTDEMFKDGYDLRSYVEMSLPHDILNILDLTILHEESKQAATRIDEDLIGLMHANAENCLLSLSRVGLACSVESPNRRMSMVHVIQELNLIKTTIASDSLMEAEEPTQTIAST
ncbi:putative receptor-like protein kinase At3g47110 [Arachis duranensis]|uniref:Receptor-like protein kinase At3g47110 n=1 Tax=Arachis duranensis TaxID=130453 RepID=A0A6P5NRB9_ARADU|nr:putative receptor-like protein kinase At3g47110 [Arachis duranensis]